MNHRLWISAGIIAMGAAAAPAAAGTAWNEAVNGDFSGDRLMPSDITLLPGSNFVIGTTGDAGTGIDRDYFRFTLSAGQQLDALVLLDNTIVSGASSFLGLVPGPVMTVTPGGAGITSDFIELHYEPGMVGSNLLAIVGRPSLQAGTYSVWLQELGGTVDYGLDLQVSAVPEPASAALLLAGLALVAGWRLRRG